MSYPESILYQVGKPARYIGGEWNAISKNWQKTNLKIAISYPDIYELSMSNMALPILYKLFNSQPDILAERVFAPWIDMEAVMRASKTPLLSLETGHPLKDFDIIGFSLGYELTYTNVLNMLDLAGIPVLASERDDSYPIVIAGGSSAHNPEPMVDFIDFFVIGEAEAVLPKLISCFREWKGEGEKLSKQELFRQIATIDGIYVPSLYHVEYQSEGLFKSITPIEAEASPQIRRQLIAKLPPPITKPVVPFIEIVHDRGAIEISRGCSQGCRFCQAGIIYRPVRQRPQKEILQAVGELITNCGYDEVSLVSLSTSDYPNINNLVARIAQCYGSQNLSLSLPSLRIDSASVKLIDSLPRQKKSGLTFAPEAGSQRLQRVINKYTPEDELMETAATAFNQGWTNLKLYFMLGLPTETTNDIESLIQLISRVHTLGRKSPGKRPNIRISLSTFIPKPHTPFQWVAQENESDLIAKHELIKQGLRHKGIRLSWQDTKVSLLEAILSRGDRRLGKVIYQAWQLGARFDGWSEHFNYNIWLSAFRKVGLEPDFYARRQRPFDEPLPWSHIDVGLCPTFLKREYNRALKGKETPDCRYKACSACGLERWHPDCQQKLQSASS